MNTVELLLDGTGTYIQPLGDIINADTDPTTIDGCNNWVVWHKRMVEKYGREEANERFATAFEDQSFWAADYNWCKYDCDWVGYFKQQGLDMGHLLSTVVCKATEATEDTLDTATELTKGGITTAKVIKTAVPLALIALLAFGGYYGYQVATGKKSLNIGPIKLGKK